jgi:hypothetical protein
MQSSPEFLAAPPADAPPAPVPSPSHRPSVPSFKNLMLGPRALVRGAAPRPFDSEPLLPNFEADESGLRMVEDVPGAELGDGRSFLDELGDEQLNMMVSFVCVERLLDKLPHDPSAHAAAASVRARLGDIASLRDVLEDVYDASHDPRFARIFASDGHLADFMRGAYVWAGIVLRALERVSLQLRDLAPDWCRLREKIDEGTYFYFRELVDLVRAEVEALRITAPEYAREVDDFSERLEQMFFAADWLRSRLQERFG